jgi:hypothetical protein
MLRVLRQQPHSWLSTRTPSATCEEKDRGVRLPVSADPLAYQESWACLHDTVDRPVDQSQLKPKK